MSESRARSQGEDPATTSAELVGSVVPPKRFACWQADSGGAAPVRSANPDRALMVVLCGILIVLGFVASAFQGIAAAAACFLVGAVLLVASRRTAPRGIATPEDIDMLEEQTDAWLAELEIEQNGVVTGRDRGTIFFDRGALGFFGHRTSFVIGSTDVHSVLDRYRVRDATNKKWHILSLITPEDRRRQRRNVYVRFRILELPWTGYRVREDRFRQQFERFRTEAPSLDSQFPPLELGPNRDTGRRSRVCAALGKAILPLGLLAFLGMMAFGETARCFAILLVLVPVLFFLWSAAKDEEIRADALRQIEWEESLPVDWDGTEMIAVRKPAVPPPLMLVCSAALLSLAALLVLRFALLGMTFFWLPALVPFVAAAFVFAIQRWTRRP